MIGLTLWKFSFKFLNFKFNRPMVTKLCMEFKLGGDAILGLIVPQNRLIVLIK